MTYDTASRRSRTATQLARTSHAMGSGLIAGHLVACRGLPCVCLFVLAVLPCLVSLPSCGPSTNFDRPLTVVVSGDTDGWLVPCGCTSNQSGGLPRRGRYVADLRVGEEVILADVGGAAAGTSPYDRLKFEAILRGERAMGAVVHNLGASELALGAAELSRLAKDTGVAWLSANVSEPSGRSFGTPLVALTAAGRRVALVGVVSERFATAEFRVAPPRPAVLDALRGSAERFDAVVVLAYLPEEELRQLAETLPEVDVIVGGPTGQPLPPVRVGPVLLTSATRQGKFLVRCTAPAVRGGSWSARIDELDERFADQEEQLANLTRFRQILQRLDLAATETSFAEGPHGEVPEDFRVAGTSLCRDCHPAADRVWAMSAHAHAWRSLEPTAANVDPACQRCHVTGYGRPGGFVSLGRSADRVDVGCECCHGPSAGHVRSPNTRTAYHGQSRDHCAGCHDRENSPAFDYDTYWEKIRHAGEPGDGKG
ncbi:MAG: hypothetical protein FJ276_20355 [Planctomycetes bacterium]|nr:hypothetical protein [Planctomycetota bacterium]